MSHKVLRGKVLDGRGLDDQLAPSHHGRLIRPMKRVVRVPTLSIALNGSYTFENLLKRRNLKGTHLSIRMFHRRIQCDLLLLAVATLRLVRLIG